MIEVVSVQFQDAGKLYYFKPCEETLLPGDFVIADTEKGETVGKVITPALSLSLEEIVLPLKNVLRKMTAGDWGTVRQLKNEEKEALRICAEMVKEHGLPMKLIGCQYSFNKSYLMFYFSSEGRVDFRALVKDLARVFKTRIELRQIGVRDVAKRLDGVGICGQRLCCSAWLREFDSISIKMSKAQHLSLNPNKMSGVCGRLMCCLRYEEETYKKLSEAFPDMDSRVKTPKGCGTVRNINIFTGKIFVHLDHGGDCSCSLEEINPVKAEPLKDKDIVIKDQEINNAEADS
ncbi:MAG TPA: stage 0 sporulation protein [Firmicutes bacterium]|nr:stage 0 sporulation protein [Bacillota bacterium]